LLVSTRKGGGGVGMVHGMDDDDEHDAYKARGVDDDAFRDALVLCAGCRLLVDRHEKASNDATGVLLLE
jgi:hypothetical protein